MIVLRKLTEKDIELLRKWRNLNRRFFVQDGLVTEKQQKKWFEEYIDKPNDLMYIVLKDNKPVGCLGICIHKGEAEIQRVMLGDKKYEHRGIMSDALQILMRTFGFPSYWLGVLKTNDIGVEFYKKNGFTVVKEEQECFIMEKNL